LEPELKCQTFCTDCNIYVYPQPDQYMWGQKCCTQTLQPNQISNPGIITACI